MNLAKNRKNKKKRIDDVLLKKRPDSQLLRNVPGFWEEKEQSERRGDESSKLQSSKTEELIRRRKDGERYLSGGTVEILELKKYGGQRIGLAECVDISSTGILLCPLKKETVCKLSQFKRYRLRFEIEGGDLPEGMEMKVKIAARLVRFAEDDEGKTLCGLEFMESLVEYAARKKDSVMITVASVLLFLISLTILLMRAESVIYFRFSKWTYLYSIITAVFLLSRYLFGAFYRSVPINPDFTPGVTIIIPCFNEEEWIQRTVVSCMNQDYPPEKLEVIVVDDCSTDASVQKVQEIVEQIQKEERKNGWKESRVSYFVQQKNAGKREALIRGAEAAKHELVVFVDSDSFLDTYAVRFLVQPFQDLKMGGVAGRTDVANTYTNGLTKMQSVRYYIAFRIMKAAEGLFDCVTCLSGPLSCYRKDIVLNHKEDWLNQKFFGQKATFGDDRAMTNFVLREYRTFYQDTAVCSTIVPNQYSVFLKQQMRWKRSWLRESLMAGSFMWKKEPFAALNFYIGLLVPILAPVVAAYNLVYVPLVYHIFPKTFLLGLLFMALMMSFAQLLLRRSTTWLFGLLFCIYYEAVLLWQMPVAWFTFWKSTWGTRMTPSDVAAQEKKEERKRKKKRKKVDSAVQNRDKEG